jgi:putative ABC transport system permease protein
VWLNKTQEQDAHLLSTVLMNTDGVAAVTVISDTLERFSATMESMNLIVVVIIFCAAGLAFIVLYNLTNINITERVREIATIKVLGFYEKETASYVFRENTVLTFLGALVGLVLGYFLHSYVMSQINIDLIAFDVHITPRSYVYSVVLTMVFAWLVNQMMKKKIDRISMTESLKSVD